MDENQQYQDLLSDVIAKQIVILGPEIAILKARKVQELEVSDEGEVTNITGDPAKALEKLVDEYVELSGQIVKSTLGSIFAQYPSIKKIE